MSYDTSKINEKVNKIKENSSKVYEKGRTKVISSSEYLKEDKQGAIVVVDDMTEIEHKVEVGLNSKNLFNEAEADITKVDDYFFSNKGFSQAPCFALKVESGATYTATVEYYTPNTMQFAQILAFTFSREKTYTNYENSIYIRLKTQDSTNGYVKDIKTFTIPDGVEEIYFIANNDETYFKNMQIEKSATATAYSPFVADFSDCKVYARGKNLLNLEGRTVVNFGAAASTSKRTFFNEKAIILGLAVNNNYANSSFDFEITKNTISCIVPNASYGMGFDVKLLPNTTYRFSCSERTPNSSVRLIEYDAEGNYIKNTTITSLGVTTTASTAWGVFMFKADTANYEHYISNPQLEYGSTITEYEPPIPETEYTANADGTVEDFNPIFPTMTLSTDTEGALVNINYIKDLQKTYNNLIINTALSGGE